MIATHRVKDLLGNTVGFLIDNNFYADYVVKENIDYIQNLKLIKNGVIRADRELDEVDYKEAVNKQEYIKLVKENPFVRDIQNEFIKWKKRKNHKVLQLEGSHQIGKTTELRKFAYKSYEYVILVDLSNDIYQFMEVVENGCKPILENITSLVKESTKLMINRDEIAKAVVWLKYAGILSMCNLAVNGDMRNIAESRKAYFSDCGIISYLASKSLLEEEVCFSTLGNYELDFMVADKQKVIYGIEVKTKDGAPISLKVYLDKSQVNKGVVAKPSMGGRGEKYDTILVYTVGCRFPYN